MKMPVQETCFMFTALVSQNGLGLKNTLAIDADVERHALLYRSVKCGVLILAEQKRQESQVFRSIIPFLARAA
jgi:hypothetical protein